MMRVAERAMAKRAAARAPAGTSAEDADARAIREARTTAKEQIAKSRTTRGALRALSTAMKLDLLMFGNVTSGPFFALLVKDLPPKGGSHADSRHADSRHADSSHDSPVASAFRRKNK